jgi:cell surface protein SprA
MQQLELDRLNLNQELYADGRFDFVPIRYEGNRAINGGTVDPRTGRIYFTTIEPFGLTLAKKLDETTPLAPFEIDGIAYTELYDSTKTVKTVLALKDDTNHLSALKYL